MVQGAKLALENGGGNADSALLNPALKECVYYKEKHTIYRYICSIINNFKSKKRIYYFSVYPFNKTIAFKNHILVIEKYVI